MVAGKKSIHIFHVPLLKDSLAEDLDLFFLSANAQFGDHCPKIDGFTNARPCTALHTRPGWGPVCEKVSRGDI